MDDRTKELMELAKLYKKVEEVIQLDAQWEIKYHLLVHSNEDIKRIIISSPSYLNTAEDKIKFCYNKIVERIDKVM